jgi:hypothetical protein
MLRGIKCWQALQCNAGLTDYLLCHKSERSKWRLCHSRCQLCAMCDLGLTSGNEGSLVCDGMRM